MHKKCRLKVLHPAVLRPQDWLRFVHLDPFAGQWDRLKLDDESLQALEVLIMMNPKIGRVVPGTGGLRKARLCASESDQGKSGAYRIFYVYLPEYGLVLLWAIIAKAQCADLTKADRNAIAKQIGRYKRLLEQGDIR